MNKSKFAVINQEKLDAFRALNLPVGQYFITGGGPLGVFNLRAINDIDIVVSQELWDVLAQKFAVVEIKGVTKIVFPGINVEATREGSFLGEPIEEGRRVSDRLSRAEIINGLPFESLDDSVFFKTRSGRPKDLSDIDLIMSYSSSNSKHPLPPSASRV